MTQEHLALFLKILESVPMIVVLGMLAYAALWLVSDRRNKNEWDVQNVYLESQLRKRYKLANRDIKVALDDQGETDRIDRPTTNR
jgi:hypothetical protein